jgi:4-azaleucine resistance transporter AzlC
MSHFSSALKTSLPALLCYLPLGMVYGVLCVKNGFPWYYAPLFSFFVLAGAMQFLALTLVTAGSSFLTISLAMIPLGIRNIFYGLTMLERYKSFHPFLRLYLAHGLVDATYSLLNTGSETPEKNHPHFVTFLTALIHAYWVLGSLLGSFIFGLVSLPDGLEFFLTAFFTAAAVEQFLSKREIKPVLIAGCSIVLALWIVPHNFFLGAISFSILICLALPYRERRAA